MNSLIRSILKKIICKVSTLHDHKSVFTHLMLNSDTDVTGS